MKKISILLIAVLLLATISACGTQEAEELKIGILPDVGAMPFIEAYEQGLFEEEGIDLEIVTFKSAVERDTALSTGSIQGAMTDTLALILFSKTDDPLKALFNTKSIYNLVSGPEGKNEGKVGISKGTVIEYALDRLKGDREIEKTYIPKMPVRLELLNNGGIDMALLPEPLASNAAQSGSTIIASSETEGFCPGIFAFSSEFISNNKDLVDKFIEVYDKAATMDNDTIIADLKDVLAEKYSFPEGDPSIYMPSSFEKASPVDTNEITDMANWMKANDQLDTLPTSDDISELVYNY